MLDFFYVVQNNYCNKIRSINPIFVFLKASMVFSIHGVFMDHDYAYKGTATLHLKNITSEVAFDLDNLVVYLFSSFGLLVPNSLDLS